MRLTWSKDKQEWWYRHGEAGYSLKYGGERIASVYTYRTGSGLGLADSWMWSCPATGRMPHYNSATDRKYWPLTDEGLAAAKADCEAYVRRHLGMPSKKEMKTKEAE